ncbi:MAG: hypothetical protein OSA98_19690 [Rubripirellula sp.]|nr:hypothetical protein [Rubripirellula sp.]
MVSQLACGSHLRVPVLFFGFYPISVRAEGVSEDVRIDCNISEKQLKKAGEASGLQASFGQIDQLQIPRLIAAHTQ